MYGSKKICELCKRSKKKFRKLLEDPTISQETLAKYVLDMFTVITNEFECNTLIENLKEELEQFRQEKEV